MHELIGTLSSQALFGHGFCMRWQSGLIWLHAGSDLAIAGAYLCIPALLTYFVRKRRDLPFHWIFWAFCLFIISCGLTHAMDVVTLWYPYYRLSGALKVLTAGASIGTAAALWHLMPSMLQLPSTSQLKAANQALSLEVAQRKSAEALLEAAYREMEEKVQARTLQLAITSNEKARSDERFRATFEQTAIGLAHVSLEGRFVLLNDRFCEIVGYSRGEMVEMTFGDITHPEDLEADRAYARELLAGAARHYRMEKRYIHKNGHIIWVNLTGSLVLDQNVPEYFVAAVEDITLRKQAEAKLLESERKFKELANAMPHVVWTADQLGRIDFFNDRWTQVLGVPDHGEPLESLETGAEQQDRQRLRGMWLESLRSGLPHEAEYTLWDRTAGEYRCYLRRVTPIRDSDCHIKSWVGTCTDIHQQKLTERALQESERRLKKREQLLSSIFDEGSMGDMTWDIATGEVSAHPSVWRMHGLSTTLGTRPIECLIGRRHPQDAEAVQKGLISALEGCAPLKLEFRLLTDDGSVRWVACRGTVIRDETGTAVQTLSVLIDITAMKIAEAEIQRRELLFRELANAMPQIVWTATPEGVIDYYNDRWYELTGSDGRTHEDARRSLLHPEDLILWTETWAASVRTARPYELQNRFWDRWHQEYRWYLGRALPVTSSEGKVSRWIGTCTEIHDQKIAEDRLEQQVRSRTMDLETSLLEKETLLKEVHHRVKNNLQVISSLLNLQISSLSDANAISALRISQRRVLAMAMIHDRLSKGSQPGYVNFGEYSGDLVRELASLYGRSGIEFNLPTTTVILTIEQAVPCGMILSELVANALKYAYPGRTDGAISIELSEDGDGIVTLAVADLGAGLPEGFDWRVTRSLGLSIVQILTKQIGGTLSVCSGVGVRFSISFPRDTKGQVLEGKGRAATAV